MAVNSYIEDFGPENGSKLLLKILDQKMAVNSY